MRAAQSGSSDAALTITIDDELDAELDRYMRARGYDNRSEALRDLARSGLQQAAIEVGGTRACVAALIYVYDHEARELPKRLTHDFHERHDLAQATLHMHLDHENCMEVTVLKGRGPDVQNSPITSSPSVACVTAMSSICRRTARTTTVMVAGTVTVTAIRTITPRLPAVAQRQDQKPRDREDRDLAKLERRLICEKCGQEFGCARDSIGECWCNAEPYRLPLPAPAAAGRAGDCLCPACLREAAAKARVTPGAAE